jgi:hypothetical protein
MIQMRKFQRRTLNEGNVNLTVGLIYLDISTL